jgi:hypothetical protein
MKKRAKPSARTNTITVEVHRRKQEFLKMFRELAWNADEVGFKTYLSDYCGIKPTDPEWPGALREFWNLVRALENERRR